MNIDLDVAVALDVDVDDLTWRELPHPLRFTLTPSHLVYARVRLVVGFRRTRTLVTGVHVHVHVEVYVHLVGPTVDPATPEEPTQASGQAQQSS